MSETETSNSNVDTADNVSNANINPGQAPDQPANTGDSGTPPADTAAEEPKRNGDGGFQRRINRLTREKHEALGRLDALERENAELRERGRQGSHSSATTDQEPRQEDYQGRYEDFVVAKAEWRAEQKLKAVEERLYQTFNNASREQNRASNMQTFERKFFDQGKGDESAKEILDELKSLPPAIMNESMAAFFVEDADNPYLLGKWLLENPDEADRISRLRPTAMGKELAKVDGQLGSKPAPRTTRAPAPVSTVGGSSAAQFDPRKTSDVDNWMKWRAQQD